MFLGFFILKPTEKQKNKKTKKTPSFKRDESIVHRPKSTTLFFEHSV